MLAAAIHNGADAVYIGVPGWNARGRTEDFSLDELEEMICYAHLRDVKCFFAMNVLVFEQELETLTPYLEKLISLNPDAFIIQDIGLARLIRSIAPNQEIHASTQMTLSSSEGIKMVSSLGFKRVVLARELSLVQIQNIKDNTNVELEVFVHGALCISYSGQCLTSESFGGRSSNRGQCAQSCRLPYKLLIDDIEKPLQDTPYLFSPYDLCGIDFIEDLLKIGVASFKVEGRLKSPEYVAAAAQAYRAQIDSHTISSKQKNALEVLFSRGLSSGWFKGIDHQTLVDGGFSNHHGEFLGLVKKTADSTVWVKSLIVPSPGDGILFEEAQNQNGGRLYLAEKEKNGLVRLEFANHFKAFNIKPNSKAYRNDSPSLEKELRKTFTERQSEKRIPIQIRFDANVGKALRLQFSDSSSKSIQVEGPLVEIAQKKGLDLSSRLEKELSALSSTPYVAESINLNIDEEAFVQEKMVRGLKQDAVKKFNDLRLKRLQVLPSNKPIVSLLEEIKAKHHKKTDTQAPELSVLIRNPNQLEALEGLSVKRVIMDFDWGVDYDLPLQRAKELGFQTGIATLKIHQPGENHYLKRILQWAPDFVLIRNLGAFFALQDSGITLTGDYSLNATNTLSADWFFEQGLSSLHPSWDLNSTQLFDLIDASDASRFEVALHQYIPAFHTQHCLFAALLSKGRRFPECEKVCSAHQVKIIDHKGELHFLQSDAECRNTLFVGKPQSALKLLHSLRRKGVFLFRLEMLDDTPETVRKKVSLYADALFDRISVEKAIIQAGIEEKYGVSEGQLFNKNSWIDRKKKN